MDSPPQTTQRQQQQIQQIQNLPIANELDPDKIIQIMRTIKKTDPLFKPLKKLKIALDSIGYNRISAIPTLTVIIFHFGLGNQLDLEFIRKVGGVDYCGNNNLIIPGKSYCFLEFSSSSQSQQFCTKNFSKILQQYPIGYTTIQHENLNRIMIVMYSKQSYTQQQQDVINIQNTPLSYKQNDIPGIILIQDFITKQQQCALLQNIDKGKWSKLSNRRVQHFGYEFKYGRNQIDKEELYQEPMPEFIAPVLKKIAELGIIPGHSFDQMTINDYFPGDGIPPHFDTHSPFEEYFVALSILSGIVMQWRKYDDDQKSLYIPSRSLTIFSGQGRYGWTHGISSRKIDRIDNKLRYRSRRISLTLRKIRYQPCKCQYYFYCDSKGYDQSAMKKNNPLLLKYLADNVSQKKLENISQNQIYHQYVIQAYNGFGFDFHNKAVAGVQKMIKKVFLQASKKTSTDKLPQNKQTILVLDVGCGNGQYKGTLQKIYKDFQSDIYYQYIGIQICQTMKQFEDKIYMDGLSLGLQSYKFDLTLSIAVIHHMTTYEQRVKMVKELEKVTSNDGRIVISVFGYEQKKDIYQNQDILLQYCVPMHKSNSNQEKLVKKQKRGDVYQRYYHLFKREQIQEIIEKANLQIELQEIDKENIIILAKKKNIL